MIVYGAGGHAAVVIDTALAMAPDRDIVVFDAVPHDPILGFDVHTGLPDTAVFPPARYRAVVAIGDCAARRMTADKLSALGYQMDTLVHPRACISAVADVGQGTVVCANAVVNPRARVAQGCIINTNATVEHDCNIGAFCHISPGAVLAGGVTLGAQSWIGANATVRETCTIGAHVVVGAGSFVNSDLAADATYFGSPARRAK